MSKIFRGLIFILIFCSMGVLAANEVTSDTISSKKETKEVAQKNNNILLNKNLALLKTSESNIELASKIIDWSAMIFAALAILLIVAGAIGLREFSNFKVVRDKMNDEIDRVKDEIVKIKGIREDVKTDLKVLKNKVKEESENIFKTIYLLNDAISNFNTGNLQNAINTLNEIKILNPSDYEATCLLARSYSGQEKYEKAIDISKSAVSLSTNPHKALYIMAEAYRRMGKFDEAIEAHRESLKLQVRTPSQNSLAYCYFKKQEFSKSEIEFKKSIKIYRNPTAVLGIAKSIMMLGQYSKARDYANETILLSKEEIEEGVTAVWSYYNLASSYFILKNKKKCIHYIEQSILTTKNKAQIREQIYDYKIMAKNKNIDQELFNLCVKKWKEEI